MQKNRKGIEAKIRVGSEIKKTHVKLVGRTTRNVRSRESGERPGSRIWSPGVSLCTRVHECGARVLESLW